MILKMKPDFFRVLVEDFEINEMVEKSLFWLEIEDFVDDLSFEEVQFEKHIF